MSDRFISIEGIARRFSAPGGGTTTVFEDLWLSMARGEFQRVRGRYAGYTRARLAQFARRLKRAIYPERENVVQIALSGPTERIPFKDAQALSFRAVQVGEPLGPLWSTYWLRVTATIPVHWRGSRVDLHWDSRSEALLWLDGRSRQGLNPGRNFATLTPNAKDGETFVFLGRSLGGAMCALDAQGRPFCWGGAWSAGNVYACGEPTPPVLVGGGPSALWLRQ